MSETTEQTTQKPKMSVGKIITMVVLMVSCYAVSFFAAQWVLAPDPSDFAEEAHGTKKLSAKQTPETAK